jgi:hypothetical protein
MRAYDTPDAPKFWLREIDALGDYAQRFLGRDRELVFTDILMVRLTDDQVPRRRVGDYIDLADMMEPRQSRIARASRAPVIGPLVKRTMRRRRARVAPVRGEKPERGQKPERGEERERVDKHERGPVDRQLRREIKAIRHAERQEQAVTKRKVRKTKKKRK